MARRFQNVPQGGEINQTVRALVDVVQYVTAQTQDKITTLPATATTAEIIDKLNQVINRLQGTG